MKKYINLNELAEDKIMSPNDMKNVKGGSSCSCCCNNPDPNNYSCVMSFPVQGCHYDWMCAMQMAHGICETLGVLDCHC